MSYTLLEKDNYIQINFSGVVTSNDFSSLFTDFAQFEDTREVLPYRITTFSEMSDFIIQYSTMFPVAQNRGAKKLNTPIKSAIVASGTKEKALAALLEAIHSNPYINLRIFSDFSEAEEWVKKAL